MKKFSVNLLKVGVLLIIGLCMMGAMNQVNAMEESNKIERIFKDKSIEIKEGEVIELAIREPIVYYEVDESKPGLELCHQTNACTYIDYTIFQKMKVETQSDDESIATLKVNSVVTENEVVATPNDNSVVLEDEAVATPNANSVIVEGIKEGTTKVRIVFGGLYYDEVEVEVIDKNKKTDAEIESELGVVGAALKKRIERKIQSIKKLIEIILQKIFPELFQVMNKD